MCCEQYEPAHFFSVYWSMNLVFLICHKKIQFCNWDRYLSVINELFVFAVANQSNHVGAGKDSYGSASRLRQTAYQQHVGMTDAAFKDSLRRTASCAPSSLPQRYTMHLMNCSQTQVRLCCCCSYLNFT
jgi:hypothetical protein